MPNKYNTTIDQLKHLLRDYRQTHPTTPRQALKFVISRRLLAEMLEDDYLAQEMARSLLQSDVPAEWIPPQTTRQQQPEDIQYIFGVSVEIVADEPLMMGIKAARDE